MNETTDITVDGSYAHEVTTRLSEDNLLPGERAADKRQLKEVLIHELQPRGAYEALLAEQLVDYEWEILRHRRLRDACCLGEYRLMARNVLLSRHPNYVQSTKDVSDEDEALLYDLSCGDPDLQAAAEQAFFDRTTWEPAQLLAMAVGKSERAQAHEDRIADLERRRRVLRKDYDDLKAVRSRPIEDAEIMDEGS